MKIPSRSLFAFFAALALIVAGCSSNGKPSGVGVTLMAFHVTDASLLEGRGTLTLRYSNENISSLGFSGSSHKLFLNGTYVGKVASEQPFGIPPLEAATQDVTVQFEDLPFVRQLLAGAESHAVAYRLESVLFQTMYEEKYQYKVDSHGSVDLHGPASAAK